ncbi:MAG TPA: hypothetical protein VG674_18020 [Amycolatopsis sp.]|jgi:hypothetical protein|nr:hypothetical protein [Amycolatopsis sp.]
MLIEKVRQHYAIDTVGAVRVLIVVPLLFGGKVRGDSPLRAVTFVIVGFRARTGSPRSLHLAVRRPIVTGNTRQCTLHWHGVSDASTLHPDRTALHAARLHRGCVEKHPRPA